MNCVLCPRLVNGFLVRIGRPECAFHTFHSGCYRKWEAGRVGHRGRVNLYACPSIGCSGRHAELVRQEAQVVHAVPEVAEEVEVDGHGNNFGQELQLPEPFIQEELEGIVEEDDIDEMKEDDENVQEQDDEDYMSDVETIDGGEHTIHTVTFSPHSHVFIFTLCISLTSLCN